MHSGGKCPSEPTTTERKLKKFWYWWSGAETNRRTMTRNVTQQPAVLVPNSSTRTPATDICTTPPTDELTTILQLVQQIHHQRTKICDIPTSWHVEMLGSGIATVMRHGKFVVQQVVELLWACRLVVLYNMSVAGVRIVEFGTYRSLWCTTVTTELMQLAG